MILSQIQSLLPRPIHVQISATSSHPLTSILAPFPPLVTQTSQYRLQTPPRLQMWMCLMVFDSLEVLVELHDDTYIRT